MCFNICRSAIRTISCFLWVSYNRRCHKFTPITAHFYHFFTLNPRTQYKHLVYMMPFLSLRIMTKSSLPHAGHFISNFIVLSPFVVHSYQSMILGSGTKIIIHRQRYTIFNCPFGRVTQTMTGPSPVPANFYLFSFMKTIRQSIKIAEDRVGPFNHIFVSL